jgi:hypothetical protein
MKQISSPWFISDSKRAEKRNQHSNNLTIKKNAAQSRQVIHCPDYLGRDPRRIRPGQKT